ncbi:hypothetical protein CVT25_008845 [Psilocybe cyanescens]|uniref:Uncharacterized protein n=1 Tax=Psilocybe cyanescens TaxID=93625 RepID=A0A409XAP8_PSICY|nr:hypothetical protein CVT25_008845 [Psilocybe cyanescens]
MDLWGRCALDLQPFLVPAALWGDRIGIEIGRKFAIRIQPEPDSSLGYFVSRNEKLQLSIHHTYVVDNITHSSSANTADDVNHTHHIIHSQSTSESAIAIAPSTLLSTRLSGHPASSVQHLASSAIDSERCGLSEEALNINTTPGRKRESEETGEGYCEETAPAAADQAWVSVRLVFLSSRICV